MLIGLSAVDLLTSQLEETGNLFLFYIYLQGSMLFHNIDLEQNSMKFSFAFYIIYLSWYFLLQQLPSLIPQSGVGYMDQTTL